MTYLDYMVSWLIAAPNFGKATFCMMKTDNFTVHVCSGFVDLIDSTALGSHVAANRGIDLTNFKLFQRIKSSHPFQILFL